MVWLSSKEQKPLGMNIRSYSRSLTPEKAESIGVQYCATPLDACRGADALTVHVTRITTKQRE